MRDYFPDEAQEHLDDVVRRLACSQPVSAEVARRYWIAQGVLWSYGSDPRATEAFVASRGVGGPWNPLFGEPTAEPDPATEYGRWLLAVPSATQRSLKLTGVQQPQVWQDGRRLTEPLKLEDGMHLLQVGLDGQPFHAQVLQVEADVELALTAPSAPAPTQVLEAPKPSPVAPKPSPVAPKPAPVAPQPSPVVRTAAVKAGEVSRRERKHTSRGVLISGLALGVVGASGLGIAAATKGSYDPSEPNRAAYVANLTSGIGGYTLLSASGILVGTSLVVNRW